MPSILWMAPALSGGGYSSEALAFAQGLALGRDEFKLRQFAEQPSEEFFHGLPQSLTSAVMPYFEPPNADPWRGVAVCHSPPDAWLPSKFPGWDALAPCPPPKGATKHGKLFTVGRTMFETDSMPADWVARCNRMDSVWVPTEFHLEAFQRAGVEAHKLVVLGEPVDHRFFDPATATPMPLPLLPSSSSSQQQQQQQQQ